MTPRSFLIRFARLVGGAAVAAGLLLSGPGAAQAQRVVATVDSTESVIDYTGSAPLHDWTGTSRSVSGTLVLDAETPDSSRAVLRVPVASFDSGNDRRDRKMREVTEAERYPTVEFRATDLQPELWGRASEGYAGRWRVTGDLTFHGHTHPVEVTADVTIIDDRVQIRATFPISLTRFEVERPSILWASIGDEIRIDARIVALVQGPSSAVRGRDARRLGQPE